MSHGRLQMRSVCRSLNIAMARPARWWVLLPATAIVLLCGYQMLVAARFFHTPGISLAALARTGGDAGSAASSPVPSAEPLPLPSSTAEASTDTGVRATAFRRQVVEDPPATSEEPVAVDPTRGIIMALHDRIVPMGVSLIRELRCLGNREVIQVFHCFKEELSQASRELLRRKDPHVVIIDVCTEMMEKNQLLLEQTMRTFQSYWVKPLALYYTNLTEVMLLDADDIFLQDPAIVRSLSGYKRTGTTFFHDRVTPLQKFFNRNVTRRSGQKLPLLHHLLEKFDYAKFGLGGMNHSAHLLASRAFKGDTCHEQDSSLVVIDKSRAGKAMDVLYHIIFDTRFQFRFSWGDKEAFWLAYELAHQEYFFSPWGLALVDSVPNEDLKKHPKTLCGSMAHYLPAVENDTDWFNQSQVLYVNGKALLDAFPADGIDKTLRTKLKSRLFNVNPTHVSARYRQLGYPVPTRQQGYECVHDQGSVPLPDTFKQGLMRRRIHYFAAETQYEAPLDLCHNY